MRARPLRLFVCALLVLAQLQSALAEIVNTVTASGTAGGMPVEATDTESVALVAASPAMAVTKSGILNDDDGVPGVSPGDTVSFTVTVANTGNQSLTAVAVSDPLIALAYTGGDIDNPGVLDVGETWTYEGAYVLTAADISTNGGGDGDIDNIVTVSAAGLQAQQAAAAVPLSAAAAPVLIAGTVFDAISRAALAGAAVTLTDSAGSPLPVPCFASPSQQGQITVSDGAYRFDILPGADPACPASATEYRLSVAQPSGYAPPPSAILPAAPGALDAAVCPPDPLPGGDCEVSPAPSAPPAGMVTYYLAIVIAAASPDVVNNHVPLDPLSSSLGTLVKTALKSDARRGEQIPFLIEATVQPAAMLSVADAMPAGFAFVPGSARVNGAPFEPSIEGQRLVFSPVTADAQGRLRIELSLVASAAVKPGRHVNRAELFDPVTGAVLARAPAAFGIVSEHAFDCSDVIGRVFADRNRNGYPDEDEKGLPEIRLATVKGLIVTTDRLGRFHVACADTPDMKSGSTFVMKLDPRSLPGGYRLTTENPRAVRLTRGKTAKLNFGAAPQRLIRLDLRAEAFAGAELRGRWRDGLAELARELAAGPSTLRISYAAQGESRELALRRIETVRALIERTWRESGGEGTLDIETRLSGKGSGAP